MGFIDKTPEGRYRAYFRDPSGKQRSKTFRTKKDANAFLAEVATSKARGSYVAPVSYTHLTLPTTPYV